MKRTGFAIFLIFATFISLSAQNKYKNIFENDLKNYMASYNNKNWEAVASMIYPKLFTISPKNEVISQLINADTGGTAITLYYKDIKKVSAPVTSGKETFCLISYNCRMVISLSGKMLEAAPTIKSTFEYQFKPENVKYDSAAKKLDVNADLYMYAISANKGKTWKYMEKNDSMSYIFDTLIPQKVLKKLAKFK